MFNDAMNSSSDMECALVSVAYIEHSLMSLLLTQLREGETTTRMFSESGTLGQISRCNDIAYCLSLIEKPNFQDIGLLAEIRNLFAHRPQVTRFSTKEVSDLCFKLSKPDMNLVVLPRQNLIETNPRERFVQVAKSTASLLLFKAHIKEAEKSQKP